MNTYQSGNKTFPDFIKFLECQYGVPHLLFADTPEEDFRNLALYRSGFRVINGTYRRFTGIGKAENGQFALPGRETAVTENGLINDSIRIFRLSFGVEKVDQRITVMCPYGIADKTAQPV